MRWPNRIIIPAIVLLCGGAVCRAAPPEAKDLVHATLLADTSAVVPGKPFHLAVHLKIVPHWHLYWINPGDGGIPTTIDLKLPPGFTATAWQYPTPQRFDQAGGLISYGYEDQAMFITTVTPPAEIHESNVTLAAEPNWLVCDKVCVPGDVKLKLALDVTESAAPNQSQLFKDWLARMPVPIGSSELVSSHRVQTEPGKVAITVNWSQKPPAHIQWYPPASQALNFKNIQVQTQDKITTITADIEQLAGQKIEDPLPDSVIGYASESGRQGLAVPIKITAVGT